MSNIIEPFKREVRYDVTKLKTGKRVNCVVVESDWPEYEIVWRMLQDRMEGKPDSFAAEIRKEQAAKIAMCVEAILELKYSNTTEVANRKANKALSAAEQDVAKFIAEIEAKQLDEIREMFMYSNNIDYLIDELRRMAAEKRAK